MNYRPSRLIRLLDATSQWLNVALFNGEANESLSGRAWREQRRRAERTINTLIWWEPDHCYLSHITDVARAHALAAQYPQTR